MQLSRTSPAVGALALAGFVALAACNGEPSLEDEAPEVAAAIERSREANPEAWQRRVIVLGMDSCDPDLIEDLIRRGKAPNFARIRREGAHGELRSLTPLLSPVIWTTIATGMTPERHGILDFVTETEQGMRPVSSRLRQADTVWELVAQAGEPVGVVGWLVSWPADEINGFIVSERIGRLAYEADRYGEGGDDAPKAVWPPEFAKDIAEKDRVTIDDLPLARLRAFVDVTEDEYAASYMENFGDPNNLLGQLRLTMADAETYRKVGERLYREHKPRLFLTYFNAMDALSHMFMPLAKPKMPHIDEETYLKFKDVIEANYIWHDHVLGEYLDMADENTTVIIVSDHGFKWGDLRTQDSSAFAAKTGAMWHRRYGVIYAIGGGVKAGHRIKGASVWDVTPTILAAMGYPVPEEMPGGVLADMFEDGLPHETVKTWFGERRRMRLAKEQAADSAGALEVTPQELEEQARLRALGYISGTTKDAASTTLNLGARLLATRRFKRAIEEYEKLASDPKQARNPRVILSLARAHILYADALSAGGDDAQESVDEQMRLAEESLAKAATIVPDEVGIIQLRGRLERLRGNLDAAESLARIATEQAPQQAGVWVGLAEVLREKMERAQAALKAARRAGRAEDALRLQSEIARLQYEAADALRQALHREPRQFHALTELAHLELASMPPPAATNDEAREHLLKRAKASLELLDASLELIPDSPKAYNNRAIALLRIGIGAAQLGNKAESQERLQEALRSSDKALEIEPERIKSWSNKAYVLWHLRDLPAAHEAAMRARDLDPTYRFDPRFLAVLAEAGTPIPPPSAE